MATRGLVDHAEAVAWMEARVADIAAGRAAERIWLVEHPPLYSAGVSAKAADLLSPSRFPVVRSGRGGQFTYHGPGQRVVYVMLDLRERGRDAHAFVAALQAWIVAALARLGVEGRVRSDRVGVWVGPAGETEAKIAAVGVKLRRWISLHGLSLNVAPDLEHFSGIVPCGIADRGVTSLAAIGAPTEMARIDAALLQSFERIFGPTAPEPRPPRS